MPISAVELRPFATTVRREGNRLRVDHPDAWGEGASLLADVGRTLQTGPTTLPERP